jgi:hypothetical protein
MARPQPASVISCRQARIDGCSCRDSTPPGEPGLAVQACEFHLLPLQPILCPSPNPIAGRGRVLLADNTIMAAQVELLLDILWWPQPCLVASGLANPYPWAGLEQVGAPWWAGPLPLGAWRFPPGNGSEVYFGFE